MRERFTRRRFLSAVGAGATYLVLTNAVGCDRSERAPQARTPKGGAPSTPKVSHLPTASPAPREGAWAFRSRPDLSPPAVEVTAQAHDTAPGFVFVSPEKGDAVRFPETDSRRPYRCRHPIPTSRCEPKTVRGGYSAPPRPSSRQAKPSYPASVASCCPYSTPT